MFWIIGWLLGRRWIAHQLLKKKAVVISGCDTGFGHDTTLALLSNGMTVYAGCYTNTGRQTLEAKVMANPTKYTGTLVALKLDVTSNESVAEFKAKVLETCPREGIYCMINNAGIAAALPLEILSFESHKSVMEVNYFGVLRMMRAFIPSLRQFALSQKHHQTTSRMIFPRIITISSIAGRIPVPLLSAYSASKHAVRVLTEVARVELSQFGIKATVIEPSFARTPILVADQAEQQDAEFEKASEEVKTAYGKPTIKERRVKAAQVGNDLMTMNPRQVVNVILNAVRLKAPADRYVVGLMGYLVIALKAALPWWIVDWIFLWENGGIDLGRRKITE
ncbi:hypothetical protein BDR26DRAFT_934525 [Obelidium mucronatum]|nr:hypothetical protein BDR26DRAFT_934525 [Obelidium mucronatum]